MILALDSSTPVLSLALGEEVAGQLVWLSETRVEGGGRHGAALPGAIADLLTATGRTLAEIEGCAVGLGPGSFTGLRVGLATVQGLAYARTLKLAGISSLRALAFEALQPAAESKATVEPAAAPAEASPQALVVALLDARHGQVYAGVFAGPSAQPQTAEVALNPNALAPWLRTQLGPNWAAARLIGGGAVAYRETLVADFALDPHAEPLPLTPSARAVGQLCWPLPAADRRALLALEPHYVRASEAEINYPDGNFRARAPA